MAVFKDKTGRELTFGEAKGKIAHRTKNVWLEFVVMMLRWVGHVPSHHVRRFFYRLAGIKIGKDSTVHMWANFFDSRNITIGIDTIIGERVFLDGRAKLSIGDHVDISSEVMILNSEHDVHSIDFHPIEEPVVIEDYVFIGPRVIIQPGVRIGRGAVVAAGAVVTKDVSPMTIVGGIPAKLIGPRRVSKLSYRLGRARWFR